MPRIHPVTGMILEDGHGALPDDEQALVLHCAFIEQTQGEEAAEAMRAKVRAGIPATEEAAETKPKARKPARRKG